MRAERGAGWRSASRVLQLGLGLCLAAIATPARVDAEELSLADAVLEALAANPDLASQRAALDANREQIELARSSLLPQIGLGVSAQIIEDDRSDDSRGFVTAESASVTAQVSQVIYDENAWAGFQVQQHVYDAQREEFESTRLGLIQQTGSAYFALDRSIATKRIQMQNRELTRQSYETTRARVASGVSSERELLRWQSQLAQNDISVEQASIDELISRFSLNEARNRPREAAVDPIPAEIARDGFIYARGAIAKAIEIREGERRLRDYLVRVAVARAPDLKRIDASIAAQNRILTANERAFWVPSLSVLAGIDRLLSDTGGSASVSETEWGARAELTFPLLAGGAKFASLRQAQDSLVSLRLERSAGVNALDQTVRAAFAQASGDYRTIGYAAQQFAAADKNYGFVYDAYVLGVADYLDLLDAQEQRLTAQLSSVNARYDFLDSLLEAEHAIAFFPFLESQAEVEDLVKGLARELETTQ